MIPGIDVSNHQGVIDWLAVAGSGKQFAICKASEGTGFTDPYFAGNWQGARAAGLVRGAYHYALPGENAPEAEAAHFLSVIEAAGGLLPGDLLALDLEDVRVLPGTDLSGWALGWLRAVEAAAGFRPLLYSAGWYMQGRGLAGNAELAEYGLWLAAYQDEPPAPDPWPVLAVWQHSHREAVPGVAGWCDADWFFGGAGQLRAYGAPAAPPAPPVLPEPDLVAAVLSLLAGAELLAGEADALRLRAVELLRGSGAGTG